MNISNLPPAMICNLCFHLSPKDLANFSQTCKNIHKKITKSDIGKKMLADFQITVALTGKQKYYYLFALTDRRPGRNESVQEAIYQLVVNGKIIINDKNSFPTPIVFECRERFNQLKEIEKKVKSELIRQATGKDIYLLEKGNCTEVVNNDLSYPISIANEKFDCNISRSEIFIFNKKTENGKTINFDQPINLIDVKIQDDLLLVSYSSKTLANEIKIIDLQAGEEIVHRDNISAGVFGSGKHVFIQHFSPNSNIEIYNIADNSSIRNDLNLEGSMSGLNHAVNDIFMTSNFTHNFPCSSMDMKLHFCRFNEKKEIIVLNTDMKASELIQPSLSQKIALFIMIDGSFVFSQGNSKMYSYSV